MTKLLFTSFRTWLPGQPSNSGDDLLALAAAHLPRGAVLLLRGLPVDTAKAAGLVQRAIRRHKPDVVVLCGMASRRRKLSVEVRARRRQTTRRTGRRGSEFRTGVDVAALVRGLAFTRVSRDAGRFVCEGLYHETLAWLNRQGSTTRCVFVHVPVLRDANRSRALKDFREMVKRLS